MLLKDFISMSVKDMEPIYGAKEARSVVQLLCEDVLGTKNYTHIVDPGFVIDKAKQPALDAGMARLRNGEPVQYVLGYASFYGFRFKVDRSVLIPRPETEQLCRMAAGEAARRKRMRSAFGGADVKVLDLCTGSGCIAWSVALSVPETDVLAADISQEALDTAANQDFKAELKQKGVKRPSFVCEDVLGALVDGWAVPETVAEWGEFDVIVSNPPYVRDMEKAMMHRNVCDFEPGTALFVPDDDPLVFYRAIAVWAEKVLVHGGSGFVEINEAFGAETADIFREAGFTNVDVMKDFCSKNRFVRFIK